MIKEYQSRIDKYTPVCSLESEKKIEECRTKILWWIDIINKPNAVLRS